MLDQSKNIDSSLEPLDEYIVIQPVSDETETRAGLILPASALNTVAVRTGIVTAVGSEPNGIEQGDKVLYPHEAGFDVRLGGIEVKVLKRSELIGRIHDCARARRPVRAAGCPISSRDGRSGRVAEGGALLRRYGGELLHRGFESLLLRQDAGLDRAVAGCMAANRGADVFGP